MGLGELVLAQLTLTNLVLGYLAYIVVKFIYQIVYYRFFHPLSVFPGPFWASVTRLWIAWHNAQETELAVVYEATKKYGMVLSREFYYLSWLSADCCCQALLSGLLLRCSWSAIQQSCQRSTTAMQTRLATISPVHLVRPSLSLT